jgi:hypothetical protein
MSYVNVVTFKNCPKLDMGGCLEMKNGRECLRLADSVVRTRWGRFKVTRTWRSGNFNRDIYAYK